ncbi:MULTISPECIES: phosphatase PAP2 family protein [Dietzia]|nr:MULTISPECIES: phosphatase PAP2 family protein [Dietzia]MCT1640493.1 phosphatase PAP2 family protein [Dietzia cinnamea]MCT1864931.1 phosphatase PAP2 family protein [Dietzia cinnamea]MCT1885358.1 phosphatase PAP2 family protein [Dietzia cinnamea]MCT2030542.1 phosphatase PAP2 family protein [Dietzia cinnamea]MCT2034417.1 phosphatase PAP2 family protein [Dietzia cinnamea]
MPDPVGSVEIPVPTGEVRLLAGVQKRLLAVPGSRQAAVTLSHVGEHALGWMAIAAAGMAVDPARRGRWAMVGVGSFGAHATSVVVKRVVRRRRPDHPSVAVGVGTPSKLSFPSSHATSTTAFALLAGAVTGVPVAPALVPVMLASRLVLGVHYPSDVVAGAAVGAGCAALTRAVWPSDAVQQVLPGALRDGAAGPRATQIPEEKR